MKVILSYSPEAGMELLEFHDGQEFIKKDCWLLSIIRDKYENEPIVFVGRDVKNRIEIEMDVELFGKLKNDPMFIIKASQLRRLRVWSKGILDSLINGSINTIDNDLDS